MFYINTKFGMIAELYHTRDLYGEPTIKAKHCIDVREALPYETYEAAEKAYKKTYMASWYHCILKS